MPFVAIQNGKCVYIVFSRWSDLYQFWIASKHMLVAHKRTEISREIIADFLLTNSRPWISHNSISLFRVYDLWGLQGVAAAGSRRMRCGVGCDTCTGGTSVWSDQEQRNAPPNEFCMGITSPLPPECRVLHRKVTTSGRNMYSTALAHLAALHRRWMNARQHPGDVPRCSVCTSLDTFESYSICICLKFHHFTIQNSSLPCQKASDFLFRCNLRSPFYDETRTMCVRPPVSGTSRLCRVPSADPCAVGVGGRNSGHRRNSESWADWRGH